MRIRLEATSVGIGTEKAVERTGIEKFTSTLRHLEFLLWYLVPGQLVNPGYATDYAQLTGSVQLLRTCKT